jgi:mono/diheme cytochrome c family protein
MRRLLPLLLGALISGAAADPAPAPAQFSASMWRFDQRSGEALYQNICQACHMPDARGANGAQAGAGAYPALAANPHLASKVYVLNTVMNGRKAMPEFGSMLDDRQVAAVANYVRSHFGNTYADTALPAEAAKLRPRRPSPNSYEQ